MKKVLLIHSRFEASGGSTVVAAWLLEALKCDYAVTLLTWYPVDLAAINGFCGTSLMQSDFVTQCACPPLLRPLFALEPNGMHRRACLLRRCKQITRDHDVFLNTDPLEADFGCRGLQYTNYPWLARHASRPAADGSVWSCLPALLRGKIRPWMVLAQYSFERMRGNLTLVNSDRTGRQVRDAYGIEARTRYPPVPGDFPEVPWERRENGFVCIGRPSPLKRIETIIEILARVRAKVPGLRLHVVCPRASGRDECAYRRRLEPLLRANASWVLLHEQLSRDELVRLACRQRYGLHAMVDEHFGIAVADMVRAGCIPFVHDSGGQVEIVGRNPHLLFATTDEAVQKIASVLNDPKLQVNLRRDLDGHKVRFSTQRFVSEIQQAVRDFIQSGGKEFVPPGQAEPPGGGAP